MTEATLDTIWKNDRLGRRQDAKFLIELSRNASQYMRSQSRPGSFVVNIDGGWGGGKTFLLNGVRDQLCADGHAVAFVDAWRSDHGDDPFLAIVSAIEDAIDPYLPADGEAVKRAKGLA